MSPRIVTTTTRTSATTPQRSQTAGNDLHVIAGIRLDLQQMSSLPLGGTTYTPTWGTNYVGTSVSLPTTLVASKTITVGFSYDATAGKWVCLAADTTGY